jgi:hypothetical protein
MDPNGFTCPDCQTTDEHLEAVVNEAMIDYGSGEQDSAGRWRAPFKGQGSHDEASQRRRGPGASDGVPRVV